MTEVLKQGQYQPLPVNEQVAIIFAAVNGHLDDVEVGKIRAFEEGFLKYLRTERSELLLTLAEKQELTDDLAKGLTEAISEFKQRFVNA